MSLQAIEQQIKPLNHKISIHPLFTSFETIDDMRIFSESHVFAVWDFMCLLKGLQGKLTCVQIPWFPSKNALGGHLINAILSEEEGDLTEDGRYLSHFELYLEAMVQIGANTESISHLISQLIKGSGLSESFDRSITPPAAIQFVEKTFKILSQDVHQIASSFIFGREDITHRMFKPIIQCLQNHKDVIVGNKFIYYFERHIVLDEGEHAPKAKQLLQSICQEDEQKWLEAQDAAIFSLNARYEFLDSIYEAIQKKRNTNI